MIENPRVRLALAEHGRTIALALAVLGAVLLVLALWTAFTPPAETVTEQANAQTIATDVDHGALVRAGDAPWDSGTVLENHPAYLLNASPMLDVTVETDAPPGSTVVHSARLRLRVVRNGEGGAVVWEDVRSLAAEELAVEDGAVTTSASVDVREVRQRRAELQREFAGVGTVQTTVLADARYETDRYDGNLTASAPLTVTDRAYWIDSDGSARDPRSETVTVTRQAPIDWSTVLTFLVLGLGAVAGAAAAATYRVEADIEWLRQELHRQRYDDWISDGDIPMGVGSEYVSLDSLQDVVDVAIDTGQRVVYDDRRDVFAVISGEVVYYYSKDGDWNRVAWPQTEREEEEDSSFLEAFGMGEDASAPEVGASPGPTEPGRADAGTPTEADTPPGEAPQGGDADVGPFGAGDERASDGGGRADDEEPGDDGQPTDAASPTEDSLGPAERPPADRPFGGDADDEDDGEDGED